MKSLEEIFDVKTKWLDTYALGGSIQGDCGGPGQPPCPEETISKEDEKAILDYIQLMNMQIKPKGSIRASDPKQTKLSKAKEIALNPLTAMGYVARNEDIPDNFSRGPRNTLDYAVDFINPAQYVEDSKNVVQGAANLDAMQFGEGLLGTVPLALEAKNIVKGVKKMHTNAKKLSNEVEQVYHTVADRNKPLYKIGSDNLENALESKIKNLQTEEGFNRLFNQELEITRRLNPYAREKDLLEKANKNANARIDELSQTENLNKSFLDAKLENPNINPFSDFGIPKNNAYFQGDYNNSIDLNFLKKINKDFVLDEGAIKPGKIAIGREYAEDIGVFDHEINHALQNGRQTKIDKDIIEHFSNLENRKKDLISKKRSNNRDEAALSYLLKGSNGKEPSSFLAEARRSMLNKGLINDVYEPITPDIIKKSMQYFSKNPIKNKYTKGSSTRIFDIANKNSAEFLSNQMNKLPVIAPIAGASYLAAQAQDKKELGGKVSWLDKYK